MPFALRWWWTSRERNCPTWSGLRKEYTAAVLLALVPTKMPTPKPDSDSTLNASSSDVSSPKYTTNSESVR